MDASRFDLLAKGVALPSRRRAILRGLRAGAVLALLGRAIVTPREAAAHHCKFEGCGCATGTRHPCARGLVCCAVGQPLPGGPGKCTQGDCDD